jgi:predicted lipoprotein
MKKIFYLLIGSFILFGCKKESSDENIVDRKSILLNIGDIIFENYNQFNIDTDSLKSVAQSFKETPNESSFNKLKTYYKNSYNSFQKVQFVNIGPAEELNIIDALNFYPEDTALIMNTLNSESFDIKAIGNKAKGIQALDYLLFGFRDLSEEDILTWYINNDKGRQYLVDICNEIFRLSNAVHKDWEDAYLQNFKDKQGIDRNSSFFVLTNAMLENYEKYCRTAKVGIPLGYNGIFEGLTPRLNLIEGRNAEISIQLIKSYMEAFEMILSGGDGLGYYEYLDQIGATFNNKPLSEIIKDRIKTINERVDLLEEPYADNIVNNRQEVKDVFSAMQQLVITLKVDVSSAMGIDIIYQDSDGD